jgi:predicted permease
VLSLTLGIGLNTALFSVAQRVLVNRLPFQHPEELLAVGRESDRGAIWYVFPSDVDVWRRASRTIVSMAGFGPSAGTIQGSAGPEYAQGATGTSNLLAVLGARTEIGRWFTPDEAVGDGQPVVVLSHSLWLRQFAGSNGALGRRLTINGKPYAVIGVLPRGVNLAPNIEYWRPSSAMSELVVRRRPQVSPADVQREFAALAPSSASMKSTGHLNTLLVVPWQERLYGSSTTMIHLLVGLVALLYILACTNVAHLALARLAQRRGEFALRAILGALPSDLIVEMLTENYLLTVLGGIAGLGVGSIAMHVFVTVSPVDVIGRADIGIDGQTVLFATLATLLAAAIVSVTPVLFVARGDLRAGLSHGGTGGTQGIFAQRSRTILVSAQVAVSLILLSSAVLVVQTMRRLSQVDVGFRSQGVVVTRLNVPRQYSGGNQTLAVLNRFAARLRSIPGVQSVAFGPPPLVAGRGPMFADGFNVVFKLKRPDDPTSVQRDIWVKFIDPEYIETFGLHLRTGRNLQRTDDAAGPAVAIVNARMAQLFFPHGALGVGLNGAPPALSGGKPITVVGVVDDVRQRSVLESAEPEVWVPLAQQDSTMATADIAVRTAASADALVNTVRSVINEVDPALAPQRLSTMQTIVEESIAPQRFLSVVVLAMAALALLISSVGLYAVTAYLTARRTREIGVRIALGSSAVGVVRLVLSDAVRMTSIGLVVGLPTAYAFDRLLEGYLVGVGASDVSAFVGAPLVLSVAGIAAVIGPAVRATRLNPLDALRNE